MKYVIIMSIVLIATNMLDARVLPHAQEKPILSSTEQVTRALHRAIQAGNVQAARVALLLGADSAACDEAGHNAYYYIDTLYAQQPKQAKLFMDALAAYERV